jgi:hypothetical protein
VPRVRLRELAAMLSTHQAPADFEQNLTDYTTLLDKTVGEDAFGDSAEGAKRFEMAYGGPGDLRADEMTDWILTVQFGGQTATTHAIEQWQKRTTAPWLVAAMMKAAPGDRAVPTLLAAAAQVPADAPAAPSLTYHTARLLIATGRASDARARLDAALSMHATRWPRSAVNALLALRTSLATDFGDFIAHATRKAAGVTSDWDELETPDGDIERAPRESALIGASFPPEVARVLSGALPLSMLVQAARSTALPPHLKRELLLASWTRAVLMDEDAVAIALTGALAVAVPEMKSVLDSYAASAASGRAFAATFAILRYPGASPGIREGLARQTPIGSIDNYRDNWWCREQDATNTRGGQPRPAPATAAFLPEPERARAKQEQTRLAAVATGPNELGRRTLDFAKEHPDDPRVPEALYLVVRSTRFGCADAETTKWSKAAFQLLHTAYPKSEWTKKTPYYY